MRLTFLISYIVLGLVSVVVWGAPHNAQFLNGLEARTKAADSSSKLAITVQFPGPCPSKDRSAVEKAVEDIIKASNAMLAITSAVKYKWDYGPGKAIDPKHFTFTFTGPAECINCIGEVKQNHLLGVKWIVTDAWVNKGTKT